MGGDRGGLRHARAGGGRGGAGGTAARRGGAGNQTKVTDNIPVTPDLYTTYDRLNRRTSLREGSLTSTTIRAEWIYDTLAKGQLTESIRHQVPGGSTQDYTVEVTGFDDRYQPTGRKWTFPSSLGFGITDYTVSYPAYDFAGHRTQTSYPGIGGLGAETVTTGFTDLGAPATLGLDSAPQYVSGTTFDDRGRVNTRTLGLAATTGSVTRSYAYDTHQRLIQWYATQRNSSGGDDLIQYDRIALDDVGNVIRRKEDIADQWECYGYDDRNRLISAYTTTNAPTGNTCGSQNSLGSAPYNHAYSYAADGRILTRTEDATTSFTYAYPGQGGGAGSKPHATTAIGQPSGTDQCSAVTGNQAYCAGYDGNGNMTSRTDATGTQTLQWDNEHRLEGTDTNGSLSSLENQFVYDAEGARLVRKTATDTTLYLEGHEMRLAGGNVTTKRYHQLAGVTVAVRDSAGGGSLNYLLGDQLGSTTVSVNAAGGTPVVQRYLPYGAPRSTTGGAAVTDRGWIGQTKDASTGLQYLNARYYDPTTGRFTATDPLADLSRPATLDAYGYAGNSPLTNSDPTGLLMPVGSGGIGDTTNGSVYLPGGDIAGGCGVGCGSGGSGSGSTGGGAASAAASDPTIRLSDSDPGIPLSFFISIQNQPAPDLNCYLFALQNACGAAAWYYYHPRVLAGLDLLLEVSGVKDFQRCGAGNNAACFLAIAGVAGGPIDDAGRGIRAARGINAIVDTSKGFSSYGKLKTAIGVAGDGFQWHHIVGQHKANLAKFGAEAIHHPDNVIRLDVATHTRVNTFYASKPSWTGGITVRDWLAAQPYEAQRHFGNAFVSAISGSPVG